MYFSTKLSSKRIWILRFNYRFWLGTHFLTNLAHCPMNPSVSVATKAQIPLIQQGALHSYHILSNNRLKKSEKLVG
ncbi:MAG TPA: hypothetical protein DGB85_03795 [Deltaproteobacteria bacterium]|nr:hypothetical protein [Deltaproteobacteria bacterium]